MFYLVFVRLGSLLLSLWLLSLVAFTMVHLLPGDPNLLRFPEASPLSPLFGWVPDHARGISAWTKEYFSYVAHLIRLDLGQSSLTQTPVLHEFLLRFPSTFELAISALLVGGTLGVGLGLLAAVFEGAWVDRWASRLSLLMLSLPTFWWGMLFCAWALKFWDQPTLAGRLDSGIALPVKTNLMILDSLLDLNLEAFLSALKHLALPTIVLSIRPFSLLFQQTRYAVSSVLKSDYVEAAEARGIHPLRLVFRYGLYNAAIPILTELGTLLAHLFSGALITEAVFSRVGIGQWMFEGILQRDYTLVQGALLLTAVLVLSVNFLIEFLYLWLHPELRLGRLR